MSKTARDVIHEWGLDEEAFEKTDALIAALAAAGFSIAAKEELADAQQRAVELAIERAEQACRYALKHQNFDSSTHPEYRSGWTVAAEVCEGAIRRQVIDHIADDIQRAELKP